jgi:hypothetical protein
MTPGLEELLFDAERAERADRMRRRARYHGEWGTIGNNRGNLAGNLGIARTGLDAEATRLLARGEQPCS